MKHRTLGGPIVTVWASGIPTKARSGRVVHKASREIPRVAAQSAFGFKLFFG